METWKRAWMWRGAFDAANEEAEEERKPEKGRKQIKGRKGAEMAKLEETIRRRQCQDV